MSSKSTSSKIKVIKHDADNKKVYRSKNLNNSDIHIQESHIDDESEKSTNPENNTSSLLPFIEKIIATPLHFMKLNANNTKYDDDSTEKYIIIGEKNVPKSKEMTSPSRDSHDYSTKVSLEPVHRPKSLAESLLNYITPNRKRKIDVVEKDEEENPKKLKIDQEEDNNEAHDENTPVNSDFGEDLGEDISDEDDNKQVIEKLDEVPQVSDVKENITVSSNNEEKNSKLTKKQMFKRKLKPPKDINKVSPLTIDLKEDHGSSKEPKTLTKNWILGDRKIQDSFYPRGLVNHGVTCYINSAIQSLLHIPALQNYLIDLYFNKENYPEISTNSVTWQLAETSKKMWQWTNNSVIKEHSNESDDEFKGNLRMNYRLDPKKLISRLEDINCMMSEWEQEDSHEYFMSLMSRLQEDSVPKGKPLNESIIHQIFGGKFNQRIKCGECGEISITQQQFYDLSLVLTSAENSKNENITNDSDEEAEKVIELEDCIEQFFKDEIISDGYNCEKCKKSNKKSIKTTKILEEPEYLCVHLKKYEFDGNESKKMKQKVEFNKYLDFNNYKVHDKNRKTPSIYQLISVTSHTGRSLSSGHYTTKALQPDGSWARYDDDLIEKISEKDVLERTNDAYYLIYARLTPLEDLDAAIDPLSVGSAGKTNVKNGSHTKKKNDPKKNTPHFSHNQKRDNNGKFTSKKKQDFDHKKVMSNKLKKYTKNKMRKEGKTKTRR
ncbi:hypothetical protein ACO0R3_004042 [Hanseniaspora guilliermondii]